MTMSESYSPSLQRSREKYRTAGPTNSYDSVGESIGQEFACFESFSAIVSAA